MTEELRRIASASLPGIHLPLVRYQPGGRFAVVEEITLVAFDLPCFGLNNAVVLGVAPSPERLFAVADEFFAGCEHGYTVRLEADAQPALEAALRARGWVAGDDLPVMVLPRIPEPVSPSPSGLVIRRVTDEALLRDYVARKSDQPSPWDGIDEMLHPSVACALDPDIALFVGYVDRRPIAQSALYRVGGIAEIGGVAVHPDNRRRGIGAALTWAAIAEGGTRGCTAAALAATAMGFPVYQRMGFVPVYDVRRYELPAGL